jgi:hypothetical protein
MSSNSVNLKPIDMTDNANQLNIEKMFNPRCSSLVDKTKSISDLDQKQLELRIRALLKECEVVLNSTKFLTKEYVSINNEI